MSTRLHRFLVVIGGLAVVAGPGVVASDSFRSFVENHPADAIYVGLATPVVLAAYRELVAWRNKNKPS